MSAPGTPGDTRYLCPFCDWFRDFRPPTMAELANEVQGAARHDGQDAVTRAVTRAVTGYQRDIEDEIEAHLASHVDEMTAG